MTITYALTEDDYLTHHLFIASKSEMIKKDRLGLQFVLSLMYTGFAIALYLDHMLVASLCFMLIGVLWYILYPAWERNKYIKYYRKEINKQYKDSIGSMKIVELDMDYILAKDDTEELKLWARDLEEINELPSVILIRFKDGQSIILSKGRVAEINEVIPFLKQFAGRRNVAYVQEERWKWK